MIRKSAKSRVRPHRVALHPLKTKIQIDVQKTKRNEICGTTRITIRTVECSVRLRCGGTTDDTKNARSFGCYFTKSNLITHKEYCGILIVFVTELLLFASEAFDGDFGRFVDDATLDDFVATVDVDVD